MPKLMIVAASKPEVAPLSGFLNARFEAAGGGCFRRGDLEIYLLISGVGLLESAANIMEAQLSFQPDFAIQAGIAGAYNTDLSLGSVVMVRDEVSGDLGSEDNDSFLDVFELGLSDADKGLYTMKKLVNPLHPFPFIPDLSLVSAMSVNRVAGSAKTIEERKAKFGADIESMEGAAFHYVCLKRGVPFIQVRSISNYVEPRDKEKWKISEAIKSLNAWLQEYIQQFENSLNL